MKTKLALITLCYLLPAVCFSVFAQGTAFTYQGRLNDGNNPANGSYDLRFTIYDSPSAGLIVGGPLTNAPTSASNGLFTVTLDPGAGVFTGPARWLEIGVRTNGSVTAYQAISPRQLLTATPYAMTAGSITGLIPAGSLSGTYPGAVTFNNSANVISGNGTGLTSLNASQLTSGTVPAAALGNAWKTVGNSGTSPTNGNFLGTTDNQPLELWVNQARALRLEPGTNNSGAPNVIGGAPNNAVAPGVIGATIAGGGALNQNISSFLPGPSSNYVSAIFGTIGGGRLNTVNADHGIIGGGLTNTIDYLSYDSVIGGGYANSIQSNAVRGVIGGGALNTIGILADSSTIGGGFANQIIGSQQNSVVGTIAGGRQNLVQTNATYSFIGGGQFNTIGSGAGSGTISGGYQNSIQSNANFSTVGGGWANVGGDYGTVGGGAFNSSSGGSATVGGGFSNTSSNSYATVSGGYGNIAGAYAATVGGGSINSSSGDRASIGGGQGNVSSGSYSTIAGGNQNTNSSYGGTVSGGANNNAGPFSYGTVGGGNQNTANWGATVGGGFNNTASGFASTVAGGFVNIASGSPSTVPGGNGNTASGDYSFAAGQNANAIHPGAFVWSDNSGGPFFSTTSNQFSVRADGGVRIESAGAGLTLDGQAVATSSQLTNLNAANITSGTLAAARMPALTGDVTTIAGSVATTLANTPVTPGTYLAANITVDAKGRVTAAANGPAAVTSRDYVFAVSSSPQPVSLPNTFQDATFDIDFQINGWTHAFGTASYTNAQSGLYLIQYTARAATTGFLNSTNVSVVAVLNSLQIPGSQNSADIQVGVVTLSKSFMANVSASDVLKLQFTGTGPGVLLTAAGGSGIGAAKSSISMTIVRIQ